MAINAKKIRQQQQQAINQARDAGQGYLTAGTQMALPNLEESRDVFRDVHADYGKGFDMYQDSLGLNGQAGSDAAFDAYRGTAGYRNALDQFGMDAETIQRLNAATGNLFSGNTAIALNDRARTLQNMAYGDWQNKLGGFDTLRSASGLAQPLFKLSDLWSDYGKNSAGLQMDSARMDVDSLNNQFGNTMEERKMKAAEDAAPWNLALGLISAGAGGLGSYYGSGRG